MTRSLLLLAALSSFACGRYVPNPDNDAGSGADGGPARADAGVQSCDPQAACPPSFSESTTIPCLPYHSSDLCSRLNRCVPEPGPWCHTTEGCFGVPTCDPGTVQSAVPCGPDEDECKTAEMCGVIIFCRTDRDCGAVPSCTTGVGSTTPCGLAEPDCEPVYRCGAAIWCRVNSDECHMPPSCGEGWVSTDYPCTLNEPFCRRASACGTTVFCRQ
jgi:hypothetical protein